jgi:hypothetical protein
LPDLFFNALVESAIMRLHKGPTAVLGKNIRYCSDMNSVRL